MLSRVELLEFLRRLCVKTIIPAEEFATTTLIVPDITAGDHTLRLELAPDLPELQVTPKPDRVLDLVGNRANKNCAGHGKNIALYTGSPSKFFYATHDLTDVFDAVDGRTLLWRPDQIVVDGATRDANPALNVNLDLISINLSQTPRSSVKPTKPPTSVSPRVQEHLELEPGER